MAGFTGIIIFMSMHYTSTVLCKRSLCRISIDEAGAYSMTHPINPKKMSALCLKGLEPPVMSSLFDVAAIDFPPLYLLTR